jgi:hypothetical protein
MRLRKRSVVTVFLVTVACSVLGPGALAAPMPWDSHRNPVSHGGVADSGYHDNGYHDSGHHENGQHDNGHHDS